MKIGAEIERNIEGSPPISKVEFGESDLHWIARANEGEAAALEHLYLKHRDWVVNLAFRFLGERDAALDVLQETFIYFFKKFPGFVLTAQLRTFLYPVVKNISLSMIRKRLRFAEDQEGFEAFPAPLEPQPESDLAPIFRDLPAAQREALTLRFIEGFSLEEIADALKTPLGTVKSRLHNALTTLRKDPATRRYFRG